MIQIVCHKACETSQHHSKMSEALQVRPVSTGPLFEYLTLKGVLLWFYAENDILYF